MRKFLLAAAAVVALALAPSASGPAIASAHPAASPSDHMKSPRVMPYQCLEQDTGPTPLCITDKDGRTASGNPIIMQKLNTKAADQVIALQHANVCGGEVTNTCPFTSTYWDKHYKTDGILWLNTAEVGPDHNECVGTGLHVMDAILSSSCPAQESEWVDVCPAPGSGPKADLFALVNVYWMNQFPNTSASYVLTGASENDQAQVQLWDGGKEQKWLVTETTCG